MKEESTNQLGFFLQSAREQKQLSLRAVQKAIGVSNAYLSQIESGKIKQPSPTILHKLSELYEVSYEEITKLAGYPVPNSNSKDNNLDKGSTLLSKLGPISDEEEEAILEYVSFLRSRHSRKG